MKRNVFLCPTTPSKIFAFHDGTSELAKWENEAWISAERGEKLTVCILLFNMQDAPPIIIREGEDVILIQQEFEMIKNSIDDLRDLCTRDVVFLSRDVEGWARTVHSTQDKVRHFDNRLRECTATISKQEDLLKKQQEMMEQQQKALKELHAQVQNLRMSSSGR